MIVPILHTYHTISLLFFPNCAADPTRSSFLDNVINNFEKNWTGDRAEYWDLYVCGVDPESQGRGVGKLLAQWGVIEVGKEGQGIVASVLCGEKNRGF
jgi:GNAT superfamily N-acetyltransferase